MDFYEAQDFFKKMHPDKLVTFEFDDKCIRQIESIYTDGNLHMINHVEYRQVKCTPQGMSSTYIPIQPHRMQISASNVKKKIASDNIFIHEEHLSTLKNLRDSNDPIFESKLNELSMHSGISKDQIMTRVS